MSVTLLRPWRSVWLPRLITAAVLVAGLPLFLRMPLWCDLTLYDLAARNLLEGGVHYRDVFDTNLPGFVWLLACIRSVVGFGAFPLRVIDLAIVAGVVLLIDRLAKRGGATPAARWWAFVGVALLYPFAVEMAHCQRDTWMALPVLAAVLLRIQRLSRAVEERFNRSVLEGALWALAVWIKPHVVLMAAGVWVVTARRIADGQLRPWRAVRTDLLGNLAGGAMVGAAGILFLVLSGTWQPFWEIVTVWAPEYAQLGRRELDMRVDQELHWFPPWSLWLVLTVPLALLSIVDSLPLGRRPSPDDTGPGPVGRRLPVWLWDREAGPDARFVRAVVSVLYLVWAFQAFYVQRGFMYVHMAETFLMFGLWAAHRWAMPFVVLVWLLVTSTAWLVADANPDVRAALMTVAVSEGLDAEDFEPEHYLVRHPLANLDRMRHWTKCWRTDMTDHERYVLWDSIKRIKDHEASPGWVELEEVAEFLRSQPRGVFDGGMGVRDYELLAWHDSPHVLYLTMNLRPGIKFMHLNTAMMIGQNAHTRVMNELWDCGSPPVGRPVPRYAVSDLGWAALGQLPEVKVAMLGPPAGGSLLPAALHKWHRASFPFNQPAVFRSRGNHGRYIVHKLTPPFGDQAVPE